MKILLAHNFKTESFSGMSYYLAHHLAKTGHEVIFLSHRPFFKSPVSYYQGKLKVYSWSSLARPSRFRDALHFAKIYLRHKPDIVLGHFAGANISILISKLLSLGRCKTYEYYHTLSSQLMQDRPQGLAQSILSTFHRYRKRIFYRFFTDTVLATSERAYHDYVKTYRLTNCIAHLTPLTDRFDESVPPLGEKLIVGYLGRMAPSKGLYPLLEAISSLKKEFIFKLAGQGSLKNKVQHIADDRQVIYAGQLDYEEVDDFIRSCDIILLPSHTDNLVTVGIETLMNNRCLVISKHTGLSEYLEDGKNCVKIDSAASSIIEALRKLNTTRVKIVQIAENGRARYQSHFSVERYLEEMEKILFGKVSLKPRFGQSVRFERTHHG